MKIYWMSRKGHSVEHLWRDQSPPGDDYYVLSACGLMQLRKILKRTTKRRCKNCERAVAR